ncbi:MAG TPA: hypothetical protein VGC04_10865 [Cellulomonas sp.]
MISRSTVSTSIAGRVQDAPGRTPRSVLSVVLSTAPFLVLAVVVALVAGR